MRQKFVYWKVGKNDKNAHRQTGWHGLDRQEDKDRHHIALCKTSYLPNLATRLKSVFDPFHPDGNNKIKIIFLQPRNWWFMEQFKVQFAWGGSYELSNL